jgi:hypothetical protein
VIEDGQKTTIQFSTTYVMLPEHVAVVVGYDFQTSHHCMECGDRVGSASMANHARWHCGLPPKPKGRAVPSSTSSNGEAASQ